MYTDCQGASVSGRTERSPSVAACGLRSQRFRPCALRFGKAMASLAVFPSGWHGGGGTERWNRLRDRSCVATIEALERAVSRGGRDGQRCHAMSDTVRARGPRFASRRTASTRRTASSARSFADFARKPPASACFIINRSNCLNKSSAVRCSTDTNVCSAIVTRF